MGKKITETIILHTIHSHPLFLNSYVMNNKCTGPLHNLELLVKDSVCGKK